MIWELDVLILSMLVLCAVAAISVKGLLSATIILSGYSFLMALLWTEMAAVDVAFTEAAVGAGVSTAFLIAVVFHARRGLQSRQRGRIFLKLVAASAVVAMGGLLLYATADFPAWGDPREPASLHVSPHYIEQSMEETSVPNVVTSVLADYRGYDTMFETAVIFAAGLAVVALLRRKRGRSPPVGETGLFVGARTSVIVQFAARQITPLIQLFALYVVAHGHHSPGGGFQGGVILGASFILLGLSYDISTVQRRFPDIWKAMLASLGVLIYSGIGILCIALGANFLDYSALSKLWPGLSPVGARSFGILGVEIGVATAVAAIMVSIYRDVASKGYGDQGL